MARKPRPTLEQVLASVRAQHAMSPACKPGQAPKSDPILAVVVTCHPAYLKWLPECLESINGQSVVPVERVLCFDGTLDRSGLSPDLLTGWLVIEGTWGTPCGGRNAGMAATVAPWLVWIDADNILPAGFLEGYSSQARTADDRVAILYTDLAYMDEEGRDTGAGRVMGLYDYWELRRQNFIDTASCWRRCAVEQAGGWLDTKRFDDWAVALNITRLGWQAEKAKTPALRYRRHAGSRLQLKTYDDTFWRFRTYGIVTLFAGRKWVFDEWCHWILNATLPPMSNLHIMDNSGDPQFSQMVDVFCARSQVRSRFGQIRVMRVNEKCPASPDGSHSFPVKHAHVARLYNEILPGVTEDLVFTIEDDVIGPLDGLRTLAGQIHCGSHIGAIGGAYPCSNAGPTLVCFGADICDRWRGMIKWADMPWTPKEVGTIGWGFTLYANWFLHRAIPVSTRPTTGGTVGADARICIQMRNLYGAKIFVHGGVRCLHRYRPDFDGKGVPSEHYERQHEPLA